jgi:hypothetical protein
MNTQDKMDLKAYQYIENHFKNGKNKEPFTHEQYKDIWAKIHKEFLK